MTRQEAQIRNHIKFRLLGLSINTDAKLTQEEKVSINKIQLEITKLICDWDNNSKLFVTDKKSTVFKKYKCWCGIKTNVPRIILDYDGFVCKKHFEEMKEINPDRIIENLNK